MLPRGWVAALVGLWLAQAALATETFLIRDIRLTGLERVSAGTVFNYLPVKVGDEFDETRSAEVARTLFKTGFFKDVALEREGDVLVIRLVEREAIAQITITGNKDVKTESLLEGLKDIGFAEGEVFDEAKLDQVTQELRRQYFSEGKYGLKITSEVTPLDGNRVAVKLDLVEGKAARIKQINIVGNRAYSTKELTKDFKLTTPTWLSWFTKNDQYSRQKLAADLETLRAHYLDDGYINFTIDSTQVSITPDKSDVYITINVTEGDRFTVSDVKLAGDLIVEPEELTALVTTRPGTVFSRKAVTDSAQKVSERLGDDGYAFANVNPVPDIDAESKTVSLTYFVDPGKRVYVRRITFTGNTKTRDEVLRREMRQMEGAWIATSKINRSKVRLQRLAFFEEVNVETPAVAGSADQVDVNFSVKERPSGNLMFGIGFSQVQGVILNTSVSQDNFLGSGKRIDFAFNNSDVNRRFGFGYNNPYWTVDGVSRGFNLEYREVNAFNANITRFDSTTFSGGVNFGIPVSENNSLLAGASFENTQIDAVGSNISQDVLDFIAREGDQYNILRLTSAFTYDTRNKALLPDSGTYHSVRAQLATPGGDLEFYKLNYDARVFFPLAADYVLTLQGQLGYGDAYGGTTVYPFFENFYSGGPRSVRGFRENTLGPKDQFGRALGGNLEVVGNAEVILPLPFLAELEQVRVTGFYDVGNVYGYAQDFDAGELRMSVGLSGLWLSPFGVLTVSLAQPVKEEPGDDVQTFQFTFGTSF